MIKQKLAKFVTFAIILCLTLSLVGCSEGNKIETLVDDYFTGVQTYDSEKVNSCFVTVPESIIPTNSNQTSDFFTSNILGYLQDSASLISYSIDNIVENESVATVYVSVSYLDASPVFTAAAGEYFSQGFALALSGASETELQNLFATIFMEKTKSVRLSMIDTTIELDCINTNNGWKLAELSEEVERKMLDIVTCNISNAIDSLNSNLSEIENDDENTHSEPEVFHDIPLGQTAEFATIKVLVNKCHETTTLSREYFGKKEATAGSKFVIFDVTIENITKNTMNYNNGFILVDDQGRTYESYSDALWYFDETFTYVDLASNIPVTGVFVYNVPNDSCGYYLYGIHADTEEGMRLWGK